MAEFEILTIDTDDRLNAVCITGRATYDWYLKATNGAEDNLTIQRKIIAGRKSYQTLRKDLARGCILPPIVLATRNVDAPSRLEYRRVKRNPKINRTTTNSLATSIGKAKQSNFYIVDGLQRTNALRQVHEDLEAEEKIKFLQRQIRLEIWLNISFGALAYRMLLLNAGQRPMSIAHQVEILSSKLAEDLSDIEGVDISRKVESRRRVRAGQFALSRVSQAFQAWLQGQPTVDVRNTVMEQLLAESAIETLGQSLSGPTSAKNRDAFHEFFEWIVQLDYVIADTHREFLGNETVLQGIAAAFGSVTRKREHETRAKKAAARLLANQKKSYEKDQDALAIDLFDELRGGIDAKRQNVGDATRQMVFRAFEEYLRSGGSKKMEECWKYGAS